MAKLVVRSGSTSGSEFKLNADRLIMGRRSANPIPIADVKASREHAVIFRKDGGVYFIQDLSRNGTLLNGQPVNKSEEGNKLRYGDRIKIGDTVMEIVDEKNEPIKIEIPGYKIMEGVGSGGMGTVYKARQLSMDRIVAIKVLNERYSANSEFVERFIREARAAGKLNHPNVIHVHDISRANGRHYFSMEFIDGSSLKDTMREKKKFDINQGLDVVLQTAKALEFAHENHIIHRDIKPDNIMLTKEGIVKIADLGIAKTFEEQPAQPGQDRRVLGTPHYMAPEQALGKTIDHRVDIYSLGATFYHMVTGTTPFAGNTAQAILKAHIQESLPAIQDLNPSVPDPVCFMIERMMAKLPEKRYPSMSALIADIERVQRGAIAGIDRVQEGESSIMLVAKKGPGKGAEKADKAPKAEKPKLKSGRSDDDKDDGDKEVDDDEQATGAQSPVAKIGYAVAMVVVFAAVVAGVVYGARYLEAQQNKTNNAGIPKAGESGKDPVAQRSNPEAKKLLAAAAAAQNNDPSLYEGNLRQIMNKYPTSVEAEEAKRKLDEYANASKENDKKNAEQALADAKKFESENGEKTAECLDKFNKAILASKNFPAVLEEARVRHDALTKKQDAETAKSTDAAYTAALSTADSAKVKGDYDGARTALKDVIAKYGNAPQKTSAEAELAKVDADAKARFKESKDAAAGLDIAPALAEWAKYTAEVKDAEAAKDADAAKQELETKAQQVMTEDITKGSEKARKYDYASALQIVHALQKKLKDTKWSDILVKKAESLKLQKDLHDRVTNLMNDKLKNGSVPIDFPIETKFGEVKWAISSAHNDMLNIDAVSTKSAPGFTRKLADFTTKEQYQIYVMFLPKPLPQADHKALSAFCAERELTTESDMHSQKASESPVQ